VLGPDWITARVEIDFRRELRGFGAEVLVRLRIERVGTSSVETSAEIVAADGAVAAQARVVVVAWDPATRRPRPLTGDARAALTEVPDGQTRAAWRTEPR